MASASHDKTAKLLDMKTGKVFYTGVAPDGSKQLCLLISSSIIVRSCLVCLFPLRREQIHQKKTNDIDH